MSEQGDPARMSSVLGATGLVLGNVRGQGDLEIRGRVQGDVHLEGHCAVAEPGLVLGGIEAFQITVHGAVRGDLIASEAINIGSTGQVEGNVSAPRVEIEAGAQVRGELQTGTPQIEARARERSDGAGARERSDDAGVREHSDGTRIRERSDGAGARERSPHPSDDGAVAPEASRSGSTETREETRTKTDSDFNSAPPRRKRRRRRGGISRESLPAQEKSSANSSITHSSSDKQQSPPKPDSGSSGHRPSTEGRRTPRQGPPVLPTFVKGARGHLRH